MPHFSADPGFLSALLTESVRWRFGDDCDIREVTAFVARAAALAKRDGPPGLPAREAEAVIRIGLGESELLEDLDLGGFDMRTVVVGVLVGLCAEWDMPNGELDDLLVRADVVAGWVLQVAPGLDRPLNMLRTHISAIPADAGRRSRLPKPTGWPKCGRLRSRHMTRRSRNILTWPEPSPAAAWRTRCSDSWRPP